MHLIFKILFIICLVYTGIITLYCVWFSSSKRAKKHGDKFEQSVAKEILKRFKTTPIRNVIMPSKALGETEADMIFVNKKGIFVVECKYRNIDLNDEITGSFDGSEWGTTNGVYKMNNPVKQNVAHIITLKELLSDLDFVKSENIINVVALNCPFSITYLGYIRSSKNNYDFIDLIKAERTLIVECINGFYWFVKNNYNMEDVYTDEEVAILNERIKRYEATKEHRKTFARNKEIEKMSS